MSVHKTKKRDSKTEAKWFLKSQRNVEQLAKATKKEGQWGKRKTRETQWLAG